MIEINSVLERLAKDEFFISNGGTITPSFGHYNYPSASDFTTFRAGGKVRALIDVPSPSVNFTLNNGETYSIYGHKHTKNTPTSLLDIPMKWCGRERWESNIWQEPLYRFVLKGYFDALCENCKVVVIGKGSNIVFGDSEKTSPCQKIVVIRIISPSIENSYFYDKSEKTLQVSSGVSLSSFAKYAVSSSLSGKEKGFEPLYGIPGTIGGGIVMNAGAYGGEIKDNILWVNALERVENNFVLKKFSKEECDFSYRHSLFQSSEPVRIITSVAFSVEEMSKEQTRVSKSRIKDILNERKSKQPLEYPSAGSVFKRPSPLPDGTPVYAAKLIEDAGLKGYKMGGMQISQKHSGFIVNISNGTTEDLKALVKMVQDKVFEQSGVLLETEILFL